MALYGCLSYSCAHFILITVILQTLITGSLQYNIRTKRVDSTLEDEYKTNPPLVPPMEKESRDSGYHLRMILDERKGKRIVRIRTKRIDYNDEDVFRDRKIEMKNRENRTLLEFTKTGHDPSLTYPQNSSRQNAKVHARVKKTELRVITTKIDPTVTSSDIPTTQYSTDPNTDIITTQYPTDPITGTISTDTAVNYITMPESSTTTNEIETEVSTTDIYTTQYSIDPDTETISTQSADKSSTKTNEWKDNFQTSQNLPTMQQFTDPKTTSTTEFHDQSTAVKNTAKVFREKDKNIKKSLPTTLNKYPSNIDLPYVVLRGTPTIDDNERLKNNDINNLQQSLFGYCSGQKMKQKFTATGCENVTIDTLVCGGVCQAPVQAFTDLQDIEEAFGTCKYCGPLEYTEKLIFMQCHKGTEKRRRWKIEVRKIYVPKRCGCIKESCYKLNKVNGEGEWDI